MSRRPEMLAKIAMQASSLFADSVKAFQDADYVSVLSPVKEQCFVKKIYFEVRNIFYCICCPVIPFKYGQAEVSCAELESIVMVSIKITNSSDCH